MGARILFIGEVGDQTDHLLEELRSAGHQAVMASSTEVGIDQLSRTEVDLTILDPDLDPGGIELLEQMGSRYPDIKLIILTAAHSVELTVKAVRSGVVDYIEKPYQISDVIDGVNRALVERDFKSKREMLILGMASTLEQLQDLDGIRRDKLPARRTLKLPGGILIDLERRQIWRGGQQIGLTPTESNLLSVFIENRERVLSHVELVALLQGVSVAPEDAPEILRPMVSRLRKKLARFPGTENWVKNIRGTGYLFDPA